MERFHKTLNQMFRVYGNKDSPEWELMLPTAVFSYKSKVHSSTGLSPYYALMAREPRMPVDLLVQLPDEDQTELLDFVRGTWKRFQLMYSYIKKFNDAVITRNDHG